MLTQEIEVNRLFLGHFSTPFGELGLLHDGHFLSDIFFPDHAGNPPGQECPLPAWLGDPLRDYFAGDLAATGAIPVRFRHGTVFQRAVWQALREIPAGETRSYGDLARAIGRPGACRAVGGANGRNPCGLVVPCHRVIAADGDIGGFSGGLAIKRWLLRHEGAVFRD